MKVKAEDGSFYEQSKNGDIRCDSCSNDTFYVNRVNYETYIKCIRCQSKVLVHEG